MGNTIYNRRRRSNPTLHQDAGATYTEVIKKKKIIASGKFLRLKRIIYDDHKKIQREWETCERKSRVQGQSIDGVGVVAILKKSGVENRIILVSQYRPPLEKHCIEFPAGNLEIDAITGIAETAEEAALRELEEETGYKGKVIHTTMQMFHDPGASSACSKIVWIEINEDDPDFKGKQHFDVGEHLEVILFPLKNLFGTLNGLINNGFEVDALLYSFAYGLYSATQNYV